MSKNFKDAIRQTEKAPALDFISTAPQSEPEPEKTPEPVAHDARLKIAELVKAESKTRRVQVLMKPSLYKQLQAKAKQQGDTMNNLINRVLEAYAND